MAPFALAYVAGSTASGLIAIVGGDKIAARPLGLSTHPNHLALTCLIGLFLALASLPRGRTMRSMAILSCIGVLSVAIVVSGSRAALLAALLGVFVLMLSYRSRSIPLLVATTAMATVFAMSLPNSIRTGSSGLARVLAPTESEADSTELRVDYYREAIELASESPILGNGLADALRFHSVPLQLLVVAGVFGVFAGAVLMLQGLRIIRNGFHSGADPLRRAVAGGTAAVWAFLLVANMLFDRYLLFFFAMTALSLRFRGPWSNGAPTGRRLPIQAETGQAKAVTAERWSRARLGLVR